MTNINVEEMSYCSMKSINLSGRSKGLLAGINHSARQIKILGWWQWHRLFFSPSACALILRFKIAHKCTQKGCLSQGYSSCSHGSRGGFFFPFSVWEVWLFLFFPGVMPIVFGPIIFGFLCDMYPYTMINWVFTGNRSYNYHLCNVSFIFILQTLLTPLIIL